MHTNISDTLTATTTANVLSGVRRPLIKFAGRRPSAVAVGSSR